MFTQESSAANRAASYREDGQVAYEDHLHHLYGRLKMLYGGHRSHQTSPPAIRVGRMRPTAGRTCMVDDRCDDLSGRTDELIAEEFPPEAVDALLSGAPPMMLLDVVFPDGTHSVREACVAAFVHDAANNRIFPDGLCRPVDPATTGPELEVSSAAAVMRSYLGQPVVAANELMVAREAVTVAVLKRDPASLLEALCMFDNERQAVFVAVDAVARANTATRQWWAAREKEGADA